MAPSKIFKTSNLVVWRSKRILGIYVWYQIIFIFLYLLKSKYALILRKYFSRATILYNVILGTKTKMKNYYLSLNIYFYYNFYLIYSYFVVSFYVDQRSLVFFLNCEFISKMCTIFYLFLRKFSFVVTKNKTS